MFLADKMRFQQIDKDGNKIEQYTTSNGKQSELVETESKNNPF